MHPPIEASVLRNNPQFEQLHRQLTSSLLNPDGSTKTKGSQKAQDAFKQELRVVREQHARAQTLRLSLGHITARAKEIPVELLEVIDIVAAQLSARLTAEDRELLQDDVDYLMDHLRPIGQLLSSYLSDIVSTLTQVAYPNEAKSPSTSTLSGKLSQEARSRREKILETQENLATARLRMAATANVLLATHTEVLERIIRILEQTKHGSLSRGLKAHAEHLAIVAENMEAKLRIIHQEALAEVYSPDAQSALENYDEHLRDAEVRLKQREKAAQEELARYESAGPDMREIVSRYAGIMKELDTVRIDIKRLGGNE